MEPYCEICNKVYASTASLCVHRRKYHSNKYNDPGTIQIKNNKSNNKSIMKFGNKDKKKKKPKGNYTCKYCDRYFSSNSNMHRHMKGCNIKSESLEKIKQMFTKSVNDEIIDLSLCNPTNSIVGNPTNSVVGNPTNSIVGNHNNMVDNRYNNNYNQNINNIQANIQNNNSNNINIQLVPLGNENLCDILSANEQIKVLKKKCESLEYLVKHIHFNQKYPQFQNIAISNLKDNVAYKYDDNTGEFIAVTKEELLNDLIENRMNDIHDFCINNDVSNRLSNRIEKLAANMEDDNYLLDKKQKMKLIVYNGTGQNKKRKLMLKHDNPNSSLIY